MQEEVKKEILEMKFDPNTIEHLGIHQYSTLPPVIAELVSNSYDAEAEAVTIYLVDNGDKEITIEDNGHGMTFNEINANFLLIGRNRRYKEGKQKSKNDKRLVIGKKGIGKLSFFGIAGTIEVETIQNNIMNSFKMDWNDLKKFGEEDKTYTPTILKKDEAVEKKQGTTIRLKSIKRKTAFLPNDLAYALSKTFTVFDEPDFKVKIVHNNDSENPTVVTNSLKYSGITKLHTWKFPIVLNPTGYEYADKITGEIIAGVETVPSSLKGVALFSRGKLVNEHSFYDLSASSFGYDYISGWLNVDFIDDWKKEVISTNRKSLIWEDDDASNLKNYLASIIPTFYNEQREKREEKVLVDFKSETGEDIPKWLESLPSHENKLADKIVKTIFKSEIESGKRVELIKYVKDSFQFEAFKAFASELEDIEQIDTASIIRLMKEWELIEAKEMCKIAIGRIETINTFEKHIKTKVNEVPTMSDFLKKFAWILDPRIQEFENEIYYSQLLREKYADDKIAFKDYYEAEPINRRLDFLCMGLASNYFIIELKKPEFVIRDKDIRQAADYRSFIESHFGNEPQTVKSVVAYVITGSIDGDRLAVAAMKTYEKANEVYVRTYHELLRNARNYHQEFIKKYELTQKK
jgi:hypothetical protein